MAQKTPQKIVTLKSQKNFAYVDWARSPYPIAVAKGDDIHSVTSLRAALAVEALPAEAMPLAKAFFAKFDTIFADFGEDDKADWIAKMDAAILSEDPSQMEGIDSLLDEAVKAQQARKTQALKSAPENK